MINFDDITVKNEKNIIRIGHKFFIIYTEY